MIELLDFDAALPKPWLALPYCCFCSLKNLKDAKSHKRLTPLLEAFMIHIALGVASALLFIHFGRFEVDEEERSYYFENWLPILHGDLQPGNVLFTHCVSTDRSARGYRNYPQVVLADIGRVREMKPADNASTFTQLGSQVELLGNHLPSNNWWNALVHIARAANLREPLDVHSGVRKALQRFITIGRRYRGDFYEPLPAAVDEYFSSSKAVNS